MAARATVDIPQPLHDRLRRRAEEAGTSIRALVETALDSSYPEPADAPSMKGKRVTGPMITGGGKLGPLFPVDENPHDLVI